MSPTKVPASFKKTLGWTFVSLMVFFLLLRLLVFEPQQEARVEDALINANTATLSQLSEALVTPLLQRKFAALYALLDSQLEKANWRRIRVINDQGRQLYPLDGWDASTQADEILISQDILVDEENIGRVELVLDFSREIQELRKSAYLLEAFQALIIALGLILMFFYHRRHIEAPLDQMARAMGELTLNNFDYPLPKAKYRELAELAQVFERSRHDIELYQKNLLELKLEADRANEAKSHFLSNMSHELRTPLNAIIGFTDLLQADPQNHLGETELTYVKNIRTAGGVLLELISQLLDLAQIEAGNQDLSINEVPAAELIESCVELVQPVAERRNVTVSYGDNSCRELVMLADPTRTRQVLLNFLSNGIKYNRTNGTGRVIIHCSRPTADRIRVTVEDNGPGIAEADITRLFKRFERLKAVNSGVEGTGIGLFLCKQLIEAMEGAVGVESEPNVGTRFWFELPTQTHQELLAEPQAKSIDSHQNTLPRHLGAGKKLLYIDDSDVNLAVISALVTTHTDLEVLIAATPAEGLRLAHEHQPEVILLDLRMPDMDGFEVLRRLRSDAQTRSTIVIAHTANTVAMQMRDIVSAGFDDLLTKPVSLNQLLITLEKYL